jgi:hypothetical protein
MALSSIQRGKLTNLYRDGFTALAHDNPDVVTVNQEIGALEAQVEPSEAWKTLRLAVGDWKRQHSGRCPFTSNSTDEPCKRPCCVEVEQGRLL